MEGDPFTGKIIGCAIEVHRELGPGLLESTYMKLSGIKTGLLINFNVAMLKDGIHRFKL
jgi:hypothetical protein